MRHFITLILAGLLLAAPLPALALNIFACEPEWGALAREVAGDKAEVFNATHARQDPHHIRAKPSLIAAIRKADLVICSGGGLESGWLPVLLGKASGSVQPGKDGYLAVADHVPMLGKPEVLDRSLGDIHPEGNPHLHLNPHTIAKAAQVLSTRLQRLDQANAAYYREREAAFQTRWRAAIAHWEKQAARLKGMKVVVYHTNWLYLEAWLGLERVAALEPAPGIPPTVTHLEEVLTKVKARPAQAILRAPHEPATASEWLSERTGTPALELPYTVGDETGTLEALFDRTLTLLGDAR